MTSSQEYRNKLANELKQVRSLPLGGKEKELAEVLLAKSKDTPEYQQAKQETVDQRNERISMQQESFTQPSEINEEENSSIQTGEFIQKYERDHQLEQLLNQSYFNNDKGWFSPWWVNRYFDEGSIIFTHTIRNSKIFTFDGEKLIDSWENYRSIDNVGEFYVWLKEYNPLQRKPNNSIYPLWEYTLFDKEGKVLKKLRGSLHTNIGGLFYTEQYIKDAKEVYALYDKDLKLIKEDMTKEDYERVLYNEPVYIEYNRERDEKSNLEYQERKNASWKYDITFKNDDYYVDEIKDSKWNTIFKNEDGVDYTIEWQRKSDMLNLQVKERINKGLFVLQWSKNGKYVSSKFINANNSAVLSFNDSFGMFIEGNTVKHFVNSNDAELYDVNAKKLGNINFKFHDWSNEHTFQLIDAWNNTCKVVENLTGSVNSQVFSKILRVYDESEEKVLVVETDEGMKEIRVKK